MFKNPRWLVATGLLAAIVPMSTLANHLPAPSGVACSYDGQTASISWEDDAGPRYAAEFEAVYVLNDYEVEVTYKVELEDPTLNSGEADVPSVIQVDVDGDLVPDELTLDSLTGKVKSKNEPGSRHRQNSDFNEAACEAAV